MSHKEVFAAAAAAARELREEAMKRRAKIDAEIARLDAVISFDVAPALDDAAPKRAAKGTWPDRIVELIGGSAIGLRTNEIIDAMRAKYPRERANLNPRNIERIIGVAERHKCIRRDEERRWHSMQKGNRA